MREAAAHDRRSCELEPPSSRPVVLWFPFPVSQLPGKAISGSSFGSGNALVGLSSRPTEVLKASFLHVRGTAFVPLHLLASEDGPDAPVCRAMVCKELRGDPHVLPVEPSPPLANPLCQAAHSSLDLARPMTDTCKSLRVPRADFKGRSGQVQSSEAGLPLIGQQTSHDDLRSHPRSTVEGPSSQAVGLDTEPFPARVGNALSWSSLLLREELSSAGWNVLSAGAWEG